MPVIDDFNLAIDPDEILQLRTVGDNPRTRPRMAKLVREILDELEIPSLIRPRATYSFVAVTDMMPGQVTLAEGTVLHAPLLTHHMAGAAHLVPVVVTIGQAIDAAISDCFARGASLKAVLLEEIANQFLFKAAEHCEKSIAATAAGLNLQTSGTLAPGHEGIEFDNQVKVLKLSGADYIGIRMSRTGVMDPVHSTSFIIGAGSRMRYWTQAENCQTCAARVKCPHRRETSAYAECA
jgi:hypothetical protein